MVAGVLGLCAVMIVTSGYVKVILSVIALAGVAYTVARIASYPHEHQRSAADAPEGAGSNKEEEHE